MGVETCIDVRSTTPLDSLHTTSCVLPTLYLHVFRSLRRGTKGNIGVGTCDEEENVRDLEWTVRSKVKESREKDRRDTNTWDIGD